MVDSTPILTIVTRHLGSRDKEFQRLAESIAVNWSPSVMEAYMDIIAGSLKASNAIAPDVWHVVYVDNVGLGWLECSKVLEQEKDMVRGHYVWILDDDDICTSPALALILKRVKAEHDSDVILVRNLLTHPHLGNIIFPSDPLWNAKDISQLTIGSMGSSNIIVKNQIYKDYIKFFATVDRREHDWFYIEAVLKKVMDKRFSILWLDELVMRQLKSNRGG